MLILKKKLWSPWFVQTYFSILRVKSVLISTCRRLGAKGSYLTLVRVADRIL